MSKCAVESCPSDAVSPAWVSKACPLVGDDEYAAILAAGRCAHHTLQLFGADVAHRGKPLTSPALVTSDGTIDRGRRVS